jgi:hypothetical protein
VAKKRVASKAPPWTFPKNTLEEALRIPRALEDKNAGKPMKAGDLVRAVGYKMATDWRFLDLLRSANLYGLVGGTGANAEVAMEKTGADVVAPSSASQRQAALVEAFRNVDQFKRVEEHYRGKRIPEDEFFENTLVRDFDVPRDRVAVRIKQPVLLRKHQASPAPKTPMSCCRRLATVVAYGSFSILAS